MECGYRQGFIQKYVSEYQLRRAKNRGSENYSCGKGGCEGEFLINLLEIKFKKITFEFYFNKKGNAMSITLSKEMPLEEIKKRLKKLPSGKKMNVSKHLGVLKVKENPLTYQKRLRDEWE